MFSCCHFHTQTLVWWYRKSCFWACYNLRQICVGRFLAQRCLLVLRCLIFCQNSFKQFNGSQRVILTSAPGSTRVPDEVLLGYWHYIAWVIGEQVWTISISLDFVQSFHCITSKHFASCNIIIINSISEQKVWIWLCSGAYLTALFPTEILSPPLCTVTTGFLSTLWLPVSYLKIHPLFLLLVSS